MLKDTVDELFNELNLDDYDVCYYDVLEILNIKLGWALDTVDELNGETEDAEDDIE